MIAEAFLVCALALTPASVHQGQDKLSAKAFLAEYDWIKSLLVKMFPGNEFLIQPSEDEYPRGYVYVSMHWRGYAIYRRVKKSA